MKKLMIAAAIVCAAAMSQAAAITWQSGNLVDHAGVSLGESKIYTAQIYFFSDAEGKNDISSTFAGTLTDSTADKNGGYSASTKSSGIESGTYYAKLVIEGNAGTAAAGWSLTSDIGEFTYSSTAQSATKINFLSGLNMGGSPLYDNTSTATNYGWQSVPEPTSGLLLLLGVAGLALRRRRA